ncbi:MAG: shikimate dehydrogenase, partial [Kiritimatiellaeota bacterium]|nr:shikimate dehydrogenase [Kiritimatiellota bacterium]
MKISGQTKPFAVLGHPISHTFSPAMHNAAFAQLRRDAIYLALDVVPIRLMSILAALRDLGFGGVNLTVPLKEIAFRGLTRLDESARRLGAVNTVEFQGDGLVGHNTDGCGFLQAHQESFGRTPQGEAIFGLGAGGAGRAVALTCAAAGARALTLGDLDVTRCHRVAEELRERAPGCAVHVAPNAGGWVAAARTADLVVQATPVGAQAGDRALLGP